MATGDDRDGTTRGEVTDAAGDTADAASTPTAPAPSRGTPVTQTIGRIAVVALAVLFGIFAVTNSQPVDFTWVFGGTEVVKQGDEVVSGGVPLIILLVASFVLGAIVGRASSWRKTRELKRATRDRHAS